MTIEDNDKLQNFLYNYWKEKGDSGTQDEAIYLYANQKVIEELEKLRDKWKIEIDTMPETTDIKIGQLEGLAKAWYETRERINKLKQ